MVVDPKIIRDESQLELQQLLSPKYRLASHILFWLCYLLFFTILYNSVREQYLKAFEEVITTLPLIMATTYAVLYWLIPNYLYTKKYAQFIVLFLLIGFMMGFLNRMLLHIHYVPVYYPDYDYEKYPLTHIGKALNSMVRLSTVVFAAALIKVVKRNYQNEKLAESLQKQRMDAELNFLKSQVHPHFLFNTLNNLYSLTLQNSPKSSEVVLKLSNLLDYMLYECNVPQLPLSKEIKQIHNVIGLEQLRYGNRLEVNFSASGDYHDKQIPPLMLLPFIENAFKHGISKNLENTFISIDLNVKGNQLTFRVENSKTNDDPHADASYTRGIGLKNVRRRLDLIYENRYDLQVFDEEDTFMIVLKLELDT
jgi:two-component system LytT family sensor kinase